MSSPLFNSHEGSCSSVGMDQNNDIVDQEAKIEENVDEMSEEELERIDEQPNQEQGGDPTPFERKKRIKKSIVWDNMKIVKLKNGIKTRPRDSLDVAESSTYQEVELPDQD
ncbi:hypothetical protein ACS0TY_004674 [Phlomoides rotata]